MELGFSVLGADGCADLDPRMFAVNHAGGESLSPRVQAMLDPVTPASYHCWVLSKDAFPELHFHDHDEYWAWVRGRTRLRIRLPDGRTDEFEIGPGWLVYCVRGVEHAHRPLDDWSCFEWTGVLRPGARDGHLVRTLEERR